MKLAFNCIFLYVFAYSVLRSESTYYEVFLEQSVLHGMHEELVVLNHSDCGEAVIDNRSSILKANFFFLDGPAEAIYGTFLKEYKNEDHVNPALGLTKFVPRLGNVCVFFSLKLRNLWLVWKL